MKEYAESVLESESETDVVVFVREVGTCNLCVRGICGLTPVSDGVEDDVVLWERSGLCWGGGSERASRSASMSTSSPSSLLMSDESSGAVVRLLVCTRSVLI